MAVNMTRSRRRSGRSIGQKERESREKQAVISRAMERHQAIDAIAPRCWKASACTATSINKPAAIILVLTFSFPDSIRLSPDQTSTTTIAEIA
jgi:hypothetical protein